MRLDVWLWAVRVYKTRSIAIESIRAGHVRLNDVIPKPAREVHPGELISARVGDITRILRVLGDPPSRIGAPLVPTFAEDLTPEPVPSPPPAPGEPLFVPRPRGTGRPTKRERRHLDDFSG